MVGNYDLFSRKAGFNAALRHFKFTTGLIGPVGNGANIADFLRQAEAEGKIAKEQLAPIINALLVDKFGYTAVSNNIPVMIESAETILEALSAWTALTIVLVYQHPEVGPMVINAINSESWASALPILRDELVVAYVQWSGEDKGEELLKQAAHDVHRVLRGESVSDTKAYVSTGARKKPVAPAPAAPKPAASPAAASGPRRITPRYSVVVTNELFHNGNVEAWKRIIASYRSTYPSLDVLIYYDNERIKDINSLFKWGKVKHGTPILISVAGSEIKDVSKLQRYLFEGASPRFESFLKGSIDQPLELF